MTNSELKPDLRSKKFIQELKDRKVFQSGTAYLVASFVILQVGEIVIPALLLPDWALTALVVAVALGFPVVLVLAWVFEFTLQGIRFEDSPTHGDFSTSDDWDISQLPDDSLAVLPFIDSSPEQDQEYFVDGITQALINKLARVDNLHVISRTSVMRMKDTSLSTKDIARQLNVRYLVEGSIVRVADKVRIDACLIDVSLDHSLWAESYNRDVADVLQLQSDVALSAAGAIRETLTPAEHETLAITLKIEPEVYNLYLLGLHAWNKCSHESLLKAEEYFNDAIDLDPSCALAYSGLGDTYSMLMFYNAISYKEALPKIEHAAIRAIRLDNSLAEAHTSLACVQLWKWNFKESQEEFRKALDLNSNYAHAYHWYANLLCFAGQGQQALEQIQQAKNLDPLSSQISNSFAWVYYIIRNYDAAIEELTHTIELDPGFANAYLLLALNLLEMGDSNGAMENVEKASEVDPLNHEYKCFRAYILARTDRIAEALDVLSELKDYQQIIARVAIVHIAIGDIDHALDELEMAYDDDPSTVLNLKLYPWYDPVRNEPRFQKLAEKLAIE